MEFIDQCQTVAQKHFAIQTLRQAQKNVFELIYKNSFVLATLPTGSGKTLLYAVPAMLFQDGPVIVISPLISLMRDQARRMEEANIPCVLFTSDQTESERKKSNFDFWNPETKLIFVSPERFILTSFFKKLQALKPSMVVIDEAHCIISWGHQFRPEYSEMGKYLNQLRPKRILALTATASAVTRQEIIQKMFQTNAQVAQFVSNPVGKHIRISSMRAFSFEEQKEKLFSVLQKTTSKKSIVYFSTRKQCEEFALLFKSKKLHAVVYHAGLSKNERLQMETYIHETKQKTVICATTAFGLGVDIADVTLVIVYGFPSNIEEFLQMIGRAGRNGQASEGILIWTGSDPAKRQFQFSAMFPTSQLFLEQCQKIDTFFPRSTGESHFILKTAFENVFAASQKIKTKEKLIEGFLGALRVCQMTKDILAHEEYYEITLEKRISFDQLTNNLPPTITKRKKLLEGIKKILLPSAFQSCGVRIVVSLTELLDASEVSEQTCDDILKYYSEQKNLTFLKINSIQAQQGVIMHNPLFMLRANLHKYIKARQHFASSLQELKKMAEAPRCRLESSFRYFEVPNMYKQANYCLQCDLCHHYKRI